MPSWFYTVNGEQLGPVAEPEIRKQAASGRISAEDLVWREGMAEWITAADAGFFGAGGRTSTVPLAAVASDVTSATPLPLTDAMPTIAEAPVIENDDGPFYKIGSRFRVCGARWEGMALASRQAIYLLKINSRPMIYQHFGTIGTFLSFAFGGSDDVRTCDVNDLPRPVWIAMGRKGPRKCNVIVLPRGAVSLVKTRGFNNVVSVSVGADQFELTTGLFSKDETRQFLVDSGWTVDQEVTPTATAIYGEGYGRSSDEIEKMKPSALKRLFYIAIAVALIVAIIHHELGLF
jgi:hypothetical protein